MSSLLDKTTFEEWIEKVMARFDKQDQLLASIVNKGENTSEELQFEGGRLMDNQDVCQMLNLSKRSVQRHRSSGQLKYHKIGCKTYYKEYDVLDFIRNHFSNFKRNQGKSPKHSNAK